MADTNYVKPGWKTTEFWAMACSAFFGVLIVTGVITNKESNDILAYVNNIMGSGVTIVSVASYIFSRGKTKSKPDAIDYVKIVEEIRALILQNNTLLESMNDKNVDKVVTKMLEKK